MDLAFHSFRCFNITPRRSNACFVIQNHSRKIFIGSYILWGKSLCKKVSNHMRLTMFSFLAWQINVFYSVFQVWLVPFKVDGWQGLEGKDRSQAGTLVEYEPCLLVWGGNQQGTCFGKAKWQNHSCPSFTQCSRPKNEKKPKKFICYFVPWVAWLLIAQTWMSWTPSVSSSAISKIRKPKMRMRSIKNVLPQFPSHSLML